MMDLGKMSYPKSQLTTIEPAANFDLTTLAALEVALGLSLGGQPSRQWAESCIAQASHMISAHCRRVFAAERYKEIYTLSRKQSPLLLARYPVSSVESVSINDRVLDPAVYQLEPSLGLLHRLDGRFAGRWAGKVAVTYVAGWILPGGKGLAGTDAQTLPKEIEQAALDQAQACWRAASLRKPAPSALTATACDLVKPFRSKQLSAA